MLIDTVNRTSCWCSFGMQMRWWWNIWSKKNLRHFGRKFDAKLLPNEKRCISSFTSSKHTYTVNLSESKNQQRDSIVICPMWTLLASSSPSPILSYHSLILLLFWSVILSVNRLCMDSHVGFPKVENGLISDRCASHRNDHVSEGKQRVRKNMEHHEINVCSKVFNSLMRRINSIIHLEIQALE